MVLLALPPADHRLIERDRGNCAFSATPHDGQRPCRGLAEDSRQNPAELRIPGAAAQTRVVSMAGIRLGSGKSARPFKGIICVDISEFESSHPSQAVRSPPADTGAAAQTRMVSVVVIDLVCVFLVPDCIVRSEPGRGRAEVYPRLRT